jgi:two-component system, NarL family, response regulator DesR
VSAIVAVVANEARERLVSRIVAAGFTIAAAVADETSLRNALSIAAPQSWMAAAGDPLSVRAFAQLAGEARRPFVAFIDGRDGDFLHRLPLANGGGVLDSSVRGASLQAALAAVREGLIVLAPGPSVPAVVAGLRTQPLSPREREILTVAAAGLSTKAIARQLELSPNTVKFHLRAAFEKLGAATRTEAVVTAIRRGELSI